MMKGKVLGKLRRSLAEDQYMRLLACTTGRGGHRSWCREVYDSVSMIDGKPVAHVYDAGMERTSAEIDRPDRGTWQDLFREIMDGNM